ncbi:MAG: RNA-binding protein [Anaerolineae bacterium]
MEVKVYVGNLSYTTTEADLRILFAKAGQVASVALIKDRDTGNSKGFAFVEMNTQAEAQKAVSMLNGFNLEDRELKVNLARPREERGSGFGRSSGFGNRGGSRR